MKKFIIRNDDVAFDTTLEEIQTFCQICDKYGFQVLQAIIPIGEAKKITSSRTTNDQIKALRFLPTYHMRVIFRKASEKIILNTI